MENKRNSMIDILKGVAMIFVLIQHSVLESYFYLVPFWAIQAVPLFIIVSGYVYSMSYERNGIQTLSECYGFRFVTNKVIRYTIPFIMVYMVEVLIEIVKNDITFNSFVINLVCGGSAGMGAGSYYYPIMMQFIFVFPFVYCIIKKYNFTGVIICFLINGIYELMQRCYGMNEATYRLLVFRYIFLMGIGCYIYKSGGVQTVR